MAILLGRLNVDVMLRELTAKQWIEWEAFMLLDPWALDPELRADYRAASIRQTVHNMQVTKREHLKQLKDFLLPFEKPDKDERPKRTQTLEQQWGMLQLLAAMHANDEPPKLS